MNYKRRINIYTLYNIHTNVNENAGIYAYMSVCVCVSMYMC